MILAVSTSSPQVEVGVWDGESWCLFHREGGRNASAAVAVLIKEAGIDLSESEGFLADTGPGSFSGVKVGVTMVKAWGFAFGKPVYGVSSFDLIGDGAVAIASKRGEVYFRAAGGEGEVLAVESIPEGARGYGDWTDSPVLPSFGRLKGIDGLEAVDAAVLVPTYVAQPSISVPKQAHIMGETFRQG